MPEPFAARLRLALADDARFEEPATQALRRYLDGFDGAHFHLYGLASSPPDQVTASDLIAVTFLSMEINRRTTAGFTPRVVEKIDQSRDLITNLLRKVPADRDLHTLEPAEFDHWLGDDDSPATALWKLLRHDIGVPRVATYKLLARKRPALLPVRDSATDLALGRVTLWWQAWWDALSANPDIVDDLIRLRHEVNAPDLSLLRVADIVIWMRFNKGRP